MPYAYREKTCVVCRRPFTPKSGVATTCSADCRKVKNEENWKRFRSENPARVAGYYEKSKPKRVVWLRENTSRMTETARSWRVRNADSWDAYMNSWRAANRERARAYDSARRANMHLPKEDRDVSVEYRRAIKNDPCFYCGRRMSAMHTDHVVPLKLGGTDHWWNLTRACERCNTSKRKHCVTWAVLRHRRDHRNDDNSGVPSPLWSSNWGS